MSPAIAIAGEEAVAYETAKLRERRDVLVVCGGLGRLDLARSLRIEDRFGQEPDLRRAYSKTDGPPAVLVHRMLERAKEITPQVSCRSEQRGPTHNGNAVTCSALAALHPSPP